jgi:pyruvate dehydrogenase E2 component (dihydrolipoamide acetyltransferase)
MAEIVMPRLSDTMEEGTILRWLKRDGEHVARGEELVEIETDKAAMVYESDEEGVLAILAGEGDTLAVGAPIAQVGERATAPDSQPTAGDRTPSPSSPGHQTSPASPSSSPGDRTPSAPPSPALPPTPDSAAAGRDNARVKASPVARRVAQERDVDLHRVEGSGPGGRIVKADVEGAAAGGKTAGGEHHDTPLPASATTEPATSPGAAQTQSASPATLAERVATAKGETTIVELTRTQQTIARRMAESKATIPDFALQMEIDMEACVALRSELKRLSPEAAPTYNDMIVKACALALREHPPANGGYRDGKLQLHSRVNVGIAVATDDALVVPTVFDADLKSLGEIAREAGTLARRVRAGTITPPELGGGTFTVSNLGMYGVRSFTAIVNPPQAAILSVGALAPHAVVRTGSARTDSRSVEDPREEANEIVVRQTLTVTLACDHRILYGADAARFLARIRELLEEPAALTL